eukprot:COSAG02_NODE_11613_length_1689_cov_2.084906_1_plen_56_part_00
MGAAQRNKQLATKLTDGSWAPIFLHILRLATRTVLLCLLAAKLRAVDDVADRTSG